MCEVNLQKYFVELEASVEEVLKFETSPPFFSNEYSVETPWSSIPFAAIIGITLYIITNIALVSMSQRSTWYKTLQPQWLNY